MRTVQLNKSDRIPLTGCQVQTGYWNLGGGGGLQGQGITPGPQDMPAIEVTVRRSAGNNGGPVQFFFGPFVGINTSTLSATATAVTMPPGSADRGSLFPMAISQAVADQAAMYNSPSHTIRIGSNYHYPTDQAGQWTSFLLDENNVPAIRNLIANGNPNPLKIGDKIWIEPGTKTTLYSDVPVGTDVLLPVVTSIETHAEVPLISFIPFHITASVGGSGKYVEGYFLSDYYAHPDPGAGSNPGPYYGAFTPSRLVK